PSRARSFARSPKPLPSLLLSSSCRTLKHSPGGMPMIESDGKDDCRPSSTLLAFPLVSASEDDSSNGAAPITCADYFRQRMLGMFGARKHRYSDYENESPRYGKTRLRPDGRERPAGRRDRPCRRRVVSHRNSAQADE